MRKILDPLFLILLLLITISTVLIWYSKIDQVTYAILVGFIFIVYFFYSVMKLMNNVGDWVWKT